MEKNDRSDNNYFKEDPLTSISQASAKIEQLFQTIVKIPIISLCFNALHGYYLQRLAASLTFLRGSNFQVRTAVSAGLMPLSRQTALLCAAYIIRCQYFAFSQLTFQYPPLSPPMRSILLSVLSFCICF